jgi:anti-sigma factor NepR-like protein
MMRHQPTLFNQLKFPGSLASGLRSEFAHVVAEPVPERLVALMRKLQAAADETPDERSREDGDRGPDATAMTDGTDRRGTDRRG